MQYCGLFVLVTRVQHIVLHCYVLMLILHAAEILEIDLKICMKTFLLCEKYILTVTVNSQRLRLSEEKFFFERRGNI